MRNKCLALITLLFVAFSGFAQKANNDVKAQINDIKKKTNLYIYGEATAATAQDAQDLAEEILYDEINKWAATRKKLQGTSDFLINNKKSMVSSLATTRGNMFRCLMYVKKSDIQKADNADVVENTLPQQPAQRMQTTVESITPTSHALYPDAVRELARISNYQQIIARAREMKASGNISELVDDRFPQEPGAYYLVVYSTDGKVKAILTPGTKRINVLTGDEDSEKNYRGCKAFAFKAN